MIALLQGFVHSYVGPTARAVVGGVFAGVDTEGNQTAAPAKTFEQKHRVEILEVCCIAQR